MYRTRGNLTVDVKRQHTADFGVVISLSLQSSWWGNREPLRQERAQNPQTAGRREDHRTVLLAAFHCLMWQWP